MSKSTGELTPPEFVFGEVMERLRLAIGAPTKAALAKALGMESNTYANRERSGSIPWEQVLRVCVEHGLSTDQVLTGRESQHVDARHPLDVELLTAVLTAIDAELAKRRETRSAQKRAKAAGVLYEYFAGRQVDQAAFGRFLDAVLET